MHQVEHEQVSTESIRPVKFRFKFLGANGKPKHGRSLEGRLDGRYLVLDDWEFDIWEIALANCVLNRLAIWLVDKPAEPMVFAVNTGNQRKLHKTLNQLVSRHHAESHRQSLRQKGSAHLFRTVECPHCCAVIDLTHLPKSPQVYCPYCETLISDVQPASTVEQQSGICADCGLYGRPKAFSVMYLIITPVFIHVRSKVRYACGGCLRQDAWRMLIGNLLFILFVPVAIWQLVRLYCFDSEGNLALAGLHRANRLQRRGKWQKAAQEYELICSRQPHCAGVRYNWAKALWGAGEVEEATRKIEQVLQECPTYLPAWSLLSKWHACQGLQPATVTDLGATWPASPWALWANPAGQKGSTKLDVIPGV